MLNFLLFLDPFLLIHFSIFPKMYAPFRWFFYNFKIEYSSAWTALLFVLILPENHILHLCILPLLFNGIFPVSPSGWLVLFWFGACFWYLCNHGELDWECLTSIYIFLDMMKRGVFHCTRPIAFQYTGLPSNPSPKWWCWKTIVLSKLKGCFKSGSSGELDTFHWWGSKESVCEALLQHFQDCTFQWGLFFPHFKLIPRSCIILPKNQWKDMVGQVSNYKDWP